MTDDELVSIATEFRSGILDDGLPLLMCFAVSAPLQAYLKVFHDFATELVEGDLGHMNHFWLSLPDGRVLDPTADQLNVMVGPLGLPPVYLGPPLSVHPALTDPNNEQ